MQKGWEDNYRPQYNIIYLRMFVYTSGSDIYSVHNCGH